MTIPRIAPKNPLVVDYSRDDAYAMQALEKGEASDVQQKRCLDLIVNGISCAFDVTFRPGQPDVSDFAAGKAFVGQQIYKLLRLNPAKIKDKSDVSSRSEPRE